MPFFSRSWVSNYYYYSVWMITNLQRIRITFFCVFFGNIIKVFHFCIVFFYIVTFNIFFLLTISLVVRYAYVFNWIYSILWSSLADNAILLISSVNTFCFSLLLFCCDFNINLLFLWILYGLLVEYLHKGYFFLVCLFYFQFELLLNNIIFMIFLWSPILCFLLFFISIIIVY